MIQIFNKSELNCKYFEIKLQRDSTKVKEKINLKKFLMYMPKSVLNIMRLTEGILFELLTSFITKKRIGKLNLTNQQIDIIKNTINILLIDDSIDSGQTIKTIKEKIVELNPRSNIKIAVITMLYKKQSISPDYLLYHRTSIRFPWSMDTK
jgi:hypoxanthine-guanine phosphoribosyltransferase